MKDLIKKNKGVKIEEIDTMMMKKIIKKINMKRKRNMKVKIRKENRIINIWKKKLNWKNILSINQMNWNKWKLMIKLIINSRLKKKKKLESQKVHYLLEI